MDRIKESFRAALSSAMSSAGWDIDPTHDASGASFWLGAFRRPIGHDFSVTAQFIQCAPEGEGLAVFVHIGVSYEPAYRLWPLLLERERDELSTSLEELAGSSERIEIAKPGQVGSAVASLVQVASELGPAWATRYADLDALLEAIRSSDDADGAEVVPVVLAASGRLEEARRALADYEAGGDPGTAEREYQRLAYQLRRWMDSGAALPEAPTARVGPSPRAASEGVSFSTIYSVVHKRRQAVETTRRRAGRGTRQELREALSAELASRGAEMTPAAFEAALDGIEARRSPLGTAAVTVRGIKALVDFGGFIQRLVREGVPPTPEWLEPPIAASYRVQTRPRTSAGSRIAVEPAADSFLRRIVEEAPSRVAGHAMVTAWIRRASGDGSANGIEVCVGTEVIGKVPVQYGPLYTQALEAASRRGEYPVLSALVTSRPSDGRYLVELTVPAP
ncbi:MAG: hypothetical protein ACYCTI_04580 [Acidimicrobiales bacterium]